MEEGDNSIPFHSSRVGHNLQNVRYEKFIGGKFQRHELHRNYAYFKNYSRGVESTFLLLGIEPLYLHIRITYCMDIATGILSPK